MRIENTKMLAYFDALDKVRYYNMCTDIVLAGDDYKVMEIVFFADHPDGPFSDLYRSRNMTIPFCSWVWIPRIRGSSQSVLRMWER